MQKFLMSPWKIRPALFEDAQAITDLILLCSRAFIFSDFTEDGKRHFTNDNSLEMTQGRLQVFEYHVAIDIDGRIIGVVALRSPSHLYSLYVSPKYHGEGLGRALWEQVSARVSSVNSSRYALPFYKKLGFIGDEKKTYMGTIYYPLSRQN